MLQLELTMFGGRGAGSNAASGNLITEDSTDFGKPGTYELYRSGNLDAPNGMIFLSASPAETSVYAFTGDKESLEQYQIDIKNPLVVSEDTDRNNLVAAWKILHPGEDPKLKTSGMPAKKWQQMDKQNAKALENSEYDAIIYKKANGKHEVQIPKSASSNLKQTNSFKSEKRTPTANKNEFVSLISGPAYKNKSGMTVHRVDRQFWKFDRKKGFIKTKFVKGEKIL